MSETFAEMVQRNMAAARDNPDHRPDGSGLDDGVPLSRWLVNGRKKDRARVMRAEGKTLRAIAAEIGVSHETVNAWTKGMRRPKTTSLWRTIPDQESKP